jgi:hypothetical protein
VRAVLEDNIRLREKSEARFQAFFDKELNRLKNDFRKEEEVRGVVLVLFCCSWYYILFCICCCALLRWNRSLTTGFFISTTADHL